MNFWVKSNSLNIRVSNSINANIVDSMPYGTFFEGSHSDIRDDYTWVKLDSGYSAVRWRKQTHLAIEYENKVVIESVPWVSQLDRNSDKGNVDCGHASVLMLLKYADLEKFRELTVDDLWPEKPGRTNGKQLVNMLAKRGVGSHTLSSSIKHSAVDNIVENIDINCPVIALVDYKSLKFPVHLASGVNIGWHWLIVVGYTYDLENDVDGFIVHDPLWVQLQRDGMGGAFLPISIEDFKISLVPSGDGLVVFDVAAIQKPQKTKRYFETTGRLFWADDSNEETFVVINDWPPSDIPDDVGVKLTWMS